MSMIDAKLLFSEDQAETTVAAHDSDNIIDLGAGKDEWGDATDPELALDSRLNVVVTEAFTTSASGTLAVKLQDSPDNSTWADTGISVGATAVADLTLGKVLLQTGLPRGLDRYLKMVYTIGTGVMTAGKLTAWIGNESETLPK